MPMMRAGMTGGLTSVKHNAVFPVDAFAGLTIGKSITSDADQIPLDQAVYLRLHYPESPTGRNRSKQKGDCNV